MCNALPGLVRFDRSDPDEKSVLHTFHSPVPVDYLLQKTILILSTAIPRELPGSSKKTLTTTLAKVA